MAGNTLGINALNFMQSIVIDIWGNVSNDTDNVAMAARAWTPDKPGDRSHISLIKSVHAVNIGARSELKAVASSQ